MFKPKDEQQIKLQQEILTHNDVTNEMIHKRIRDADIVCADIDKLQAELELRYKKYQWVLEQEQKMLADRDRKLTPKDLEEIRKLIR